jgi:MoxR-like ATPase
MATPELPELEPGAVADVAMRLRENVQRAVKVDDDVMADVLVALFAEGHVLIEDYPGVGKTALARSLARSIDADYARVQCTADLLPADIVGTNVFNQRESRFEFHPGPVFANVVLVDEINRSSPKTQSGLLECMQERHVTVDGLQHELARPFVVIATQNPAEYEGTYPLPEAQLDRFMVRVSLGYPSAGDEADMLADHARHDVVHDLEAVMDVSTVRAAQAAVTVVHGSEAIRRYTVAIGEATRVDTRVELGASPRAVLMLFRAAKARAALESRDHVLPDDVQALAHSVLEHRLLLAPQASEGDATTIIDDALERVPAL